MPQLATKKFENVNHFCNWLLKLARDYPRTRYYINVWFQRFTFGIKPNWTKKDVNDFSAFWRYYLYITKHDPIEFLRFYAQSSASDLIVGYLKLSHEEQDFYLNQFNECLKDEKFDWKKEGQFAWHEDKKNIDLTALEFWQRIKSFPNVPSISFQLLGPENAKKEKYLIFFIGENLVFRIPPETAKQYLDSKFWEKFQEACEEVVHSNAVEKELFH